MLRPRVLLTDYAWPDTELERSTLEAAGFECLVAQTRDVAEVRALVERHQPSAIMTCWAPVDAEAIRASHALKLVARMGIGLDNIDVATCTERGVWVSNVPDYCVEEVSDHAVAYLLAWARGMVAFDRSVRQGAWDPTAHRLRRVRDLTVGSIGFGSIAQVTARKLRGFGCRIVATRRNTPATAGPEGVEFLGLEALLAVSDAVILHLPLTPDTRHLMNAQRLGAMRRGSLLINVSRGAIVDTSALLSALRSGHLSAALDVVEGEPEIPPLLRTDPNSILTPHVAFSSTASVSDLRRRASAEVIRVLQGGSPEKPCNLLGRG